MSKPGASHSPTLHADSSTVWPMFLLNQVSGMFAGLGYVVLFGPGWLVSKATSAAAGNVAIGWLTASGQRFDSPMLAAMGIAGAEGLLPLGSSPCLPEASDRRRSVLSCGGRALALHQARSER